jgi:hypothetical protein
MFICSKKPLYARKRIETTSRAFGDKRFLASAESSY